jgi:hypothetical protein
MNAGGSNKNGEEKRDPPDKLREKVCGPTISHRFKIHGASDASIEHSSIHHLTLLLGVQCRTERSKDALDATRRVRCQLTGRSLESGAFIVRHLVLTGRAGAMLQVIHRMHLEHCSSSGVHSALVLSSSTGRTRW